LGEFGGKTRGLGRCFGRGGMEKEKKMRCARFCKLDYCDILSKKNEKNICGYWKK
jgi:hypothetical protein